jgi:hypothetical protein
LGWNCEITVEGDALSAPLAKLLEFRPDLLHEPKLARDWAELIKEVVPHQSKFHKRLNGNYVGWNFRNRAALFVQQFGMVGIVPGRETYYLFSKAV